MAMITVNEFWDWFSANNDKYYFLDDADAEVQEELLDLFLEKLQSYSTGLYFLVGGLPNEDKELIITAEGDLEYFNDVVNLVNAAPKLEHWDIIAFKPPAGLDFKTTYNNIEIDPQNSWFLPLKDDKNPKKLGIIIGISQVISADKRKDYLFAAHIVVDTILGELVAAKDIDYLDIQQLPANFDELGYLELSSLAAFIDWFKKQ
jgi:hypothetical protein